MPGLPARAVAGLAGGGRPAAGRRRGRGRSHPGRRRAERVVTWPGARTLAAARRRSRARACARPRCAVLATGLAALRGTARLAAPATRLATAPRNLRHGPARRRAGCVARRLGTGRSAWCAGRGGPGGRGRPGGSGGGPPGARCLRHRPRCGTIGGRRRRGGRGAGRLGPAARATGLRRTRDRTARGRTACHRGLGRRGLGRRRSRGGRRRNGGPRRAAVTAVAVAARGAGPARATLRRGTTPRTLTLLGPIGAERFFEPANDRRLDRRRRRTDELAHFLELGHHGLALYTELLREFVNPDLRHYAPLLGPDLPDHLPGPSRRSGAARAPGRRQPVVFIALCSSSAHRCLDLLSRQVAVLLFHAMPSRTAPLGTHGPARCRSAPARAVHARRPVGAALARSTAGWDAGRHHGQASVLPGRAPPGPRPPLRGAKRT
jgi:hypothetical protein